jgi:hypothetical protein
VVLECPCWLFGFSFLIVADLQTITLRRGTPPSTFPKIVFKLHLRIIANLASKPGEKTSGGKFALLKD